MVGRAGDLMSYIAKDAASYLTKTVGTGQCVPFVQAASGAPVSTMWKKGAAVKGNLTLKSGTAIAIFSAAGKYESKTDGTSHAAIYRSQSATGIVVMDQWIGQPVHERPIRFNNPSGKIVNQGESYHVVD